MNRFADIAPLARHSSARAEGRVARRPRSSALRSVEAMGALRRAVSALARQQSRAFASNVNQTYGVPAETFKRKVRETARERSVGIEPRLPGSSPPPRFSPRETSSSGAPRPPADAATAGTTDGKPIEPTLNRFCFLRVMRVIVPSGERDHLLRWSVAGAARAEHRADPFAHVTRSAFLRARAGCDLLPARAACQQGKKLLGTWKIHPGEQQKWENPLMGWTSTGDALSHQFNSVVTFESKEAAVAFCDKYGWEYEVMEPQKMNPKGASTIPGAGKIYSRPKSYGDNFAVGAEGRPGVAAPRVRSRTRGGSSFSFRVDPTWPTPERSGCPRVHETHTGRAFVKIHPNAATSRRSHVIRPRTENQVASSSTFRAPGCLFFSYNVLSYIAPRHPRVVVTDRSRAFDLRVRRL